MHMISREKNIKCSRYRTHYDIRVLFNNDGSFNFESFQNYGDSNHFEYNHFECS